MKTPALSLHVAEAAGLTGQTQTQTPQTLMRMLTHQNQALPSRLWAGPPSVAAAVLVQTLVRMPTAAALAEAQAAAVAVLALALPCPSW